MSECRECALGVIYIAPHGLLRSKPGSPSCSLYNHLSCQPVLMCFSILLCTTHQHFLIEVQITCTSYKLLGSKPPYQCVHEYHAVNLINEFVFSSKRKKQFIHAVYVGKQCLLPMVYGITWTGIKASFPTTVHIVIKVCRNYIHFTILIHILYLGAYLRNLF